MNNIIKIILIYILIFSFVNYIGCYSATVVDKYDLNSENGEESIDELTIVTYNNDRIKLGKPVYQIINDTLNVVGINKTNVEIYNQPVDILIVQKDIEYIEIDKVDRLKTTGCIIGGGALVLLLTIGIVFAFQRPIDHLWPKNIAE